MTALALLALSACGPIRFELPPKDGDTDTGAPDTDVPGTDTDTDGGDTDLPADCTPASWAWDTVHTVAGADASFVGPSPGAFAGSGVLTPGDLDGDGVGDLVIEAVGDEGGGVYFVLGGVERALDQPLAGRPSLLGEPDESISQVAPLGDIDGDGLVDLSFGGWYTYLLRGRATGWPVRGEAATEADARIRGDVSTAFAPYGDFDGDGVDDWLLHGANDGGELYVLHGDDAVGDTTAAVAGSTWLYAAPDRATDFARGDLDGDGRTDLAVGHADWRSVAVVLAADIAGVSDGRFPDLAAATLRRELPFEVDTVEDVDGDGRDELLLLAAEGPPREVGLHMFLGRAAWSGELTLADAEVRFAADLLWPAWLGDVNGDGLGDLGFFHYASTDGTGIPEYYVYFGRTAWPAELTLADADVRIGGDPLSGEPFTYPTSAPLLGDLNGDRIGDFVLRHPTEDQGGFDSSGRMSVFLGRAAWPSSLAAADADLTLVGDSTTQVLGRMTAFADVDGDGCDDLVTAASRNPEGTSEGEVFVFFGQPR